MSDWVFRVSITVSKEVVKKNGRPLGSLGQNTVIKNAIKIIEQIMNDPCAPAQARVDAAKYLIDNLK